MALVAQWLRELKQRTTSLQMVVPRPCILLIFGIGILTLPGLSNARQPYLDSTNQWHERTGTTDFHRQLDQLFATHFEGSIRPLVFDGGPVSSLEPSDSGIFQIDGQATIQGRYRADPLQMPAPLFPYRPQDLADPDVRWVVGTGFQLSLPAGFSLLQRTLVGSRRQLDPTARTKDYHQMDASIEIPLATINYQTSRMHIWLGRNWEKWGPGLMGSAILDSRFPSPDGFGASYNGTSFSIRYRAGRLDDMQATDTNYHRYFFGHRIDFAPFAGLRVGLSETALVATDGAMPLWGLNPLLPWVMAEQEKRGTMEKTNIVWAVDAVWNPRHWAVYGQFLLDDFMIDSEDRDTYPDQLGVMLGLAYENLAPGADPNHRLGLEYNRLWSWTYVHRDPETIYQAWQQGIGHPAGGDSETLTVFWSRTAMNLAKSLTVWGRYHRQGQVWLGTAMDPVGSPGLPYPVPPVDSWWQTGLDIEMEPHSMINTRLQVGWSNPRINAAEDPAMSPPDHLSAASQWYGNITVSINLGRLKLTP